MDAATREMIQWAAVLLVAGGLWLVATAGVRRLRDPGAVRLCPGQRRLAPWSWFVRRGCFYDLRGLTPQAGGSVGCPECGRSVRPGQAIRTTRRLRLGRLGAALVVLGGAILYVPAAGTGRWTAAVPSLALVATKYVGGEAQPIELNRELERRVHAAELSGLSEKALAATLVRELRDDDVRYNARRAMWILSVIGDDAVPALESALRSPDRQQRQLTAHLLRQRPGYGPTDDLLHVTVEGLADDDLRRAAVWNATVGEEYLALFPELVEPHLARGLQSTDEQQRWLCALVAVDTGRWILLDAAAPILVEHLKDNDRSQDAKRSKLALLQLGHQAVPYLAPYRDSPDPQQRRLVREILAEIGGFADSASAPR